MRDAESAMRILMSALLAASFLTGPALAAQATSEVPSIGRVKPVASFHGAMPTGVTVAPNGRIFVNFPRWGDDVPFTVGEVRNGQVPAYPDAAIIPTRDPNPAPIGAGLFVSGKGP